MNRQRFLLILILIVLIVAGLIGLPNIDNRNYILEAEPVSKDVDIQFKNVK